MKFKNRKSVMDPEQEKVQEKNEIAKKPFNKKEWRRKKYSNNYKIEQWEQRRRKAVLHQYHKELKKDATAKVQLSQINKGIRASVPKAPRLSAYKAAQQEYERKQAEKKEKWQEAQKRKQEVAEALARYKKNKMERFKKLSKRTKKGQPVMKERMELLLQKLQQNV